MRNTAKNISVIIPVYNAVDYLAEAIESVLLQNLASEIIVVDDGSTDESARIAADYQQVNYQFIEHQGAGAARNYGVKIAQGDYLAFLDADDLWMPDKLARQVSSFETDNNLDITFGHVEHFISPELDDISRARLKCPDRPMPGYLAGAMLIKSSSFARVGDFPIHLQLGEFIEWYDRARQLELQILMLGETLLKRRLHNNNLTLRANRSRSDYARLIKDSLARRRQKD